MFVIVDYDKDRSYRHDCVAFDTYLEAKQWLGKYAKMAKDIVDNSDDLVSMGCNVERFRDIIKFTRACGAIDYMEIIQREDVGEADYKEYVREPEPYFEMFI